jgi:deoxyribonuclease-4
MPSVKTTRKTSAKEAPSRPARPRPRASHCFGSHLSIAGGMYRAIEEAERLGFDTVQVFVKNQRQWRASPLGEEDIRVWREHAARPGFGPCVAHATYLINLAAADDDLYLKSVEVFETELRRCDALGIPYLVVHPGAVGAQSEEAALARVAVALDAIMLRNPTLTTMPLLETTAGQGSTLGRTWQQLGGILRAMTSGNWVGVCADTCHVFAAGYDIRDPEIYEAMIALAGREVGLDRIRCWHLNDSRGDCGSRVDRHEHIGKGKIGVAGFRNVLRDERFRGLPMILETPKDDEGEWDRANLKRLRECVAEGGRTARK